jgi:hypothetical protein
MRQVGVAVVVGVRAALFGCQDTGTETPTLRELRVLRTGHRH